MKYLLALIFFMVTSVGYSQKLSEKDFYTQRLSKIKQTLNIRKVPNDFNKCAYNVYLNSKDVSTNVGYRIGRICAIKFFDQITFSDDGKKLRSMIEPMLKTACINQSNGYSGPVDVDGYCGCLVKQFNVHKLSVKQMIYLPNKNPKLYKKITTYCISANKN